MQKFIDNTSDQYKKHLRYLGLDSFQRVYKVATQIEDDLATEKGHKPHGGGPKVHYKKNEASASSSAVHAVTTSAPRSGKDRWVRGRRFTKFPVPYKEAFEVSFLKINFPDIVFKLV